MTGLASANGWQTVADGSRPLPFRALGTGRPGGRPMLASMGNVDLPLPLPEATASLCTGRVGSVSWQGGTIHLSGVVRSPGLGRCVAAGAPANAVAGGVAANGRAQGRAGRLGLAGGWIPPPPPPNGTGNSLSLGQPTPGVVKQDKSSGGSFDTTKTLSGPQRVRMSSGERPIGAAKGKQPDTEALCPPPPPAPGPRLHLTTGGGGAQWATAGARAEQGTWASHTRKHREAGGGRPEDGGVWTAKTVKRPPQQPAQPPVRRLLGAADAHTAHPATTSTAPAHQPLGSANAETTSRSMGRNAAIVSSGDTHSTLSSDSANPHYVSDPLPRHFGIIVALDSSEP